MDDDEAKKLSDELCRETGFVWRSVWLREQKQAAKEKEEKEGANEITTETSRNP